MSMFRALSLAALVAAAPLAMPAQGKIDLGGKSLADLEKGVKADSNEPNAHVAVALAYFNAKRWDDVERELKTALSLDPRLGMAHLVLSAIPYAKNPRLWTTVVSGSGVPNNVAADVATADMHYKLAFYTDPNVPLNILATVALGVDNSGDLGRAINFCHEGNYQGCNAAAVQYFSKAKGSTVAVIPRASYWYNALAAVHLNDANAAIGLFGTLTNRPEDDTRQLIAADLTRVPLKSTEMEFMVGILEDRMNKAPGNALTIYQRVAQADPTNYLAHVYAANILQTQKNWEKAIAEREAALAANQDDNLLHLEAGLTYALAGKLPDALKQVTIATEKMPRNAQAWYTLGLVKDQSADKAGAKEAYAKAIANANSRQANVANAAKTKMGGL